MFSFVILYDMSIERTLKALDLEYRGRKNKTPERQTRKNKQARK